MTKIQAANEIVRAINETQVRPSLQVETAIAAYQAIEPHQENWIDALVKAARNASNTLRSLEGTLSTIDSDERYRAREERRTAIIHKQEIQQSMNARDDIEAAIVAYESVAVKEET